MKKFTDDEIKAMSLGKAMLPFEIAVIDYVKEYIIDLERNGKITNAQKLLYHLRDNISFLIRHNWVWDK
jgi:hypothetical protein